MNQYLQRNAENRGAIKPPLPVETATSTVAGKIGLLRARPGESWGQVVGQTGTSVGSGQLIFG